MKIYVLTHCTPEGNYTPSVYKTKHEARKAMEEIIDSLVYERDTDGEIVCQYSDEVEVYEDHASVDYGDDTYDILDIYELEV